MCCRVLTDLKWVILGDAEMISIAFGTFSDLPERVSDGSDMFMKCLLTLHLMVSSSFVLVSPSSSFLRTDARARTLQRAPRKSGKSTQAESLRHGAEPVEGSKSIATAEILKKCAKENASLILIGSCIFLPKVGPRKKESYILKYCEQLRNLGL